MENKSQTSQFQKELEPKPKPNPKYMGGGIRSNRPGQKGLSFALQLIAANNWPDLLSAKMPRIQPRAVFGDKSPIVTKAHLSQSRVEEYIWGILQISVKF